MYYTMQWYAGSSQLPTLHCHLSFSLSLSRTHASNVLKWSLLHGTMEAAVRRRGVTPSGSMWHRTCGVVGLNVALVTDRSIHHPSTACIFNVRQCPGTVNLDDTKLRCRRRCHDGDPMNPPSGCHSIRCHANSNRSRCFRQLDRYECNLKFFMWRSPLVDIYPLLH
jgi:hypothetical protein